jgi:hypothetical protein
MEKTKTKKQILAEAGYTPKKGRPRISDAPMGTVWAHLPKSVIDLIPTPRSATLRNLIIATYAPKK